MADTMNLSRTGVDGSAQRPEFTRAAARARDPSQTETQLGKRPALHRGDSRLGCNEMLGRVLVTQTCCVLHEQLSKPRTKQTECPVYQATF